MIHISEAHKYFLIKKHDRKVQHYSTRGSMKIFLILGCLALTQAQTLQYEVELENDQVHVARIVMEPKEEIGLHRNALPRVIIGLKGGTITRVESDGRKADVEFPTGKAVYLPADPENELHKGINKSDTPIEVIVIQIKQ